MPGLRRAKRVRESIIVKPSHRNTLVILLVILLVLSGGMFFLGTHFSLKPKRFKAFLEYTLHSLTDEPVSIGEARLRFKDGILIIIKDFQFGRPEVMHMDVSKLEARFSFFNMLTSGSNALNLRFSQPEVTVYIKPFMEEEAANLSFLSSAEVQDGSIKLVYGETTCLLQRINGEISPSSITLSAHTLDGRARIYARKRNGKWIGKTEAGGLALDKLESGISGHVGITAGIEEQDNGINVSLLLTGENIDLQGNGKIISAARLMVDFGGSGDRILFREVNLKTDALNLKGIGNLDLTPGDSLGDAFLNIKLGSNTTDYEALVDYLPSDLSPEWLNLLLLEQVRDGSLEISLLEYNGTVKAFNDDFYNNLFIKAGLKGLSYGAGHNDDRITDVTATALFDKGDLSFKQITGRAGDSTISSVDLIFPDVAEDGLRLIVNADLDVKAKDFAKIWRAAMEPKEVFDLMAPLSKVTGGSVKATVSYKDGFEGIPPQLMGDVHLEDCSFLWSDFKLENISGSASANEFGLPFAISMSGTFNSLPITRLELNLSDLLDQQIYDYALVTPGLNFDGFRLSKESSITIKGNGKGPDFKGDITLLIKGFSLGDTEYIPSGSRINGSGKITGALWPESKLSMTDIRLPMGSAGINLEMMLKKIGGNIKMNGTISARPKGSPPGALNKRSLMGGVDMILAWGEGLPASGSITLDDMSIFLNDSLLTVNGPITISGPLLSSKRLDISHGIDTKIKLSGRMELKEKSNHFTGDIAIDGFKEKPDESSDLQIPGSLTGDATIRISNFNLMGFPFEQARMKADLNSDRLFLKNIDCSGEYGTLSGGAEFSEKKGKPFYR